MYFDLVTGRTLIVFLYQKANGADVVHSFVTVFVDVTLTLCRTDHAAEENGCSLAIVVTRRTRRYTRASINRIASEEYKKDDDQMPEDTHDVIPLQTTIGP
jgi:hypothetical protein